MKVQVIVVRWALWRGAKLRSQVPALLCTVGCRIKRMTEHHCQFSGLAANHTLTLIHQLHITGAKASASWFGSGIPGLSHRTLVLALGLELLAVALNTRNLVCAFT